MNKRKADVDNGTLIATSLVALTDMNIDKGNIARRLKTESPQLVPNNDVKTDLAVDTPEPRPTIKHPRAIDTGSSDQHNVTIWLDPGDHELEIYGDENDSTSAVWKKDGGRLREEWKKQLKEFNKKSPDWFIKARSAGCVRSVLWNAGKCYLTVDDEGCYACRTCWNTGHFCVAWDQDEEAFWLRPQLPAARTKDKRNVGPFDLEMYNSKKTSAGRNDLPAFWNKEFTA